MFKNIEMIGENGDPINVPFLANASTPYRFKAIFGDDLIVLFQTASKNDGTYDVDFITKLAFVMAMQAQAKAGNVEMSEITKDDMLDWLELFGGFEIYDKAKDILDVYLGNSRITSKEKKRVGRPSVN